MKSKNKLVSIQFELPIKIAEAIDVISKTKRVTSEKLMKVWMEERVKEEFASN